MKTDALYNGKLKYWYDQNYTYLHTCYPAWLSTSLCQFLQKQKEYTIYSPSANQAKHEEDAYVQLKQNGYRISFYVSDLLGELFYEKKADFEDFHYIHKNLPVQKIDKDRVYDLILDCKGALWYVLHAKWNMDEKLIELLIVYEGLLRKDDSILLIDGYEKTRYSTLYNHVLSWLGLRIKRFRENSTEVLFQMAYKGTLYSAFHQIDTTKLSMEDKETIQKMNLVYLTRKEITQLREELQQRRKGVHHLFLYSR